MAKTKSFDLLIFCCCLALVPLGCARTLLEFSADSDNAIVKNVDTYDFSSW